MKPADVAEFFFVGAGAMPVLLFWLGDPGLAVLALVALLFAACLAALADPEAPFRRMKSPGREGDPGPSP